MQHAQVGDTAAVAEIQRDEVGAIFQWFDVLAGEVGFAFADIGAAFKRFAVAFGECFHIRAHLPATDFDEPDELHARMRCNQRFHLLVGQSAVAHHKLRQVWQQRELLRNRFHAVDGDIADVRFGCCGVDGNAKEVDTPEKLGLRQRGGERRHIFGCEFLPGEVDGFQFDKTTERGCKRACVWDRRALEIKRGGGGRVALSQNIHAPADFAIGQLGGSRLERFIVLHCPCVYLRQRGKERKAGEFLRRRVRRQGELCACAVKACAAERDTPGNFAVGQRRDKRRDRV
ncbi:hypothetical protein SDC9_142904 [bioreactor metagenome]|uniref:Uncharacterized protein n=1 Tax=bioreactor metagenome TaxID=1076179 RepID=A0A645E2I5_9ZZZZ